MTVTVDAFQSARPEFGKTPVGVIQAAINEAILEVTPGQTLTDSAVSYLTAHKLALSPYGQNARLAVKDGTTTYYTHYKRLVLLMGNGGIIVP